MARASTSYSFTKIVVSDLDKMSAFDRQVFELGEVAGRGGAGPGPERAVGRMSRL